MNIVDIILLLIIAVSVLFALYRGFLASLLGAAACFASLFCALITGPKLAAAAAQNQWITTMLISYANAGSLISDVSLAGSPVAYVSPEIMSNILKTVSFPPVLKDVLQQNIQNLAFADQGLYSINSYISATIVDVLLEIACFLICFFLCFLLLHILINLIDHVFYFPVLRHLDGVAAAAMGVLRGGTIAYALLITIPLIRAAIPFDLVQGALDSSKLISLLYNESLLLRIIGGG